ncbi:MAG: c-type cytochrome [Gemmatimonadota bacterium]
MRRMKTLFGLTLLAALPCAPGNASAQELPEPDRSAYLAMPGEDLYQAACANCHGAGGAGEPSLPLVLRDPPVPDFTECSFASREPDADWIAVAHDGGPVRGFSPLMPAFGSMLGPKELQRVMDYIRTLCDDTSWPRGELNLPRAMFTEKAYPEDELVWTTEVPLGGEETSVMNEVVYEKRFGSRSQIEVVVPFGFRERSGGSWIGGLGDVVFGVKHALFHSLGAGSILSLGGEVKLPTGREEYGFGSGTTVLESFVSLGQILPSDAFLQLQGVAEFPTASGHDNEVVGRGVLGWSYAQGGWGRTWTPMIEAQAKKELADEAEWGWDLIPQLQVTLNTRQHVIGNIAVLIPMTDTEFRDPRLAVYVLWDWFDGGFFAGW